MRPPRYYGLILKGFHCIKLPVKSCKKNKMGFEIFSVISKQILIQQL